MGPALFHVFFTGFLVCKLLEWNSGCGLLVVVLGQQWGVFAYQNIRGTWLLRCFIHEPLCGRTERGSDLPVPHWAPGTCCYFTLAGAGLSGKPQNASPGAGGYFLVATRRGSQNGSFFLHYCVPWVPSRFPQCPLATFVHTEHSPLSCVCGTW